MPSASMTVAPVRVSGLNTLNCPSSLDESTNGGGPPELLDSTSGGGPDELLDPGLVFVGLCLRNWATQVLMTVRVVQGEGLREQFQ